MCILKTFDFFYTLFESLFFLWRGLSISGGSGLCCSTGWLLDRYRRKEEENCQEGHSHNRWVWVYLYLLFSLTVFIYNVVVLEMLMSFYECAGAESSIIESAEDLSARTTLIIAPLSVLSNWLVGIQRTQQNTHSIKWKLLNSACHAFLLSPFVCVRRTSLSSTCALTWS